MSGNISELSGRKGLKENLFELLGKAAQKEGTPDAQSMEQLASDFLIGKANVYGSVSFYDFLRPDNKGKKVYVCNGSACLTAGRQDILKNKLLSRFKEEEIGEMCCLGRCHENSAFHHNGLNYSGDDIDHLDEISAKGKISAETFHSEALGTPVLMEEFPGLDEYYALWKRIISGSAEFCLQELKDSGLRGRGGAGFPIAYKLDSCRLSESEVKFIVCNADEGDPGAYSDRWLLEQRPHAVLLGMMIAGFITGARYGVLYIRGEYPESVQICEDALAELRSRKLIGPAVSEQQTFSFDFKIIKAQGAYICGEETALLSSIEGQRPEVRVRPPYPTQRGLFNKPTVVNNVETLACIPWVMKHGGKAFAALGKGRSTGTKLISLDGFFNRPGIYEVEMGTPLSVVVNELGIGFREPVKAMHIGGPLGGLVPLHKINELTIDFESFSAGGFLLGHASVVCLPERFPVIDYLEHLFQFTAHESCGKCFPCRLGSTRGYELLSKARHHKYTISRELFDDLLNTMETASLCALGGGLPLPIKNALHYFQNELKPYFVS